MQSKREYAASLGLAKAGARGKFSNAAKEAIAKAEAEGMKFSDVSTGPVSKPTGKPTVNSAGSESDQRTDPRDSLYVSPSDFRFPEGEYKAVGTDGKTYSMRECCNTCQVSLVNHACNAPTIHDNMTVNIREMR